MDFPYENQGRWPRLFEWLAPFYGINQSHW